jgi:hypothetical protein
LNDELELLDYTVEVKNVSKGRYSEIDAVDYDLWNVHPDVKSGFEKIFKHKGGLKFLF